MDRESGLTYFLDCTSLAYHGRTGNGDLDNLALGRINEGLKILEVLNLDGLVVSVMENKRQSLDTCRQAGLDTHVILPVTASEGGL